MIISQTHKEMEGFKVDIVSKHIIKPSSPTPETKRIFKLSLIDQITPAFHGTSFFFFSPTPKTDPSDIFRCLQESLPRILPKFYPLAGQLMDPSTIVCNDEGVYFIKARVNCKMGDLLEKPDKIYLNQLHSIDKNTIEESFSNAISIFQFNIFDCGGVAISVSTSHKLGDINTVLAFLKAWTTSTRGGDIDEEVVPEFIGGSLLPPRDDLIIPDLGVLMEPVMTQRFVFHRDKIDALKEKIAENSGIGQESSRVEAVLAVILKNAIEAMREVAAAAASSEDVHVHDQSVDTMMEPAMFFQTVNIRSMMKPPLSQHSIGNLLWQYPVFIEEGNGIQLHEIVAGMRKEMKEMREETAQKLKGEEGFMEIMESLGKWAFHFMTNKNIYRCSSWCRSGLYETDFGWGKPVWISGTTPDMKNIIGLMDTADGHGVEADVILDEKEMAIFEKKGEILEFALRNPSIPV